MSTKWTVDLVIEVAAKKDGWFLARGHLIRRGDSANTYSVGQCPISCLDDKPTCSYSHVSEVLNIPDVLRKRIVDAADMLDGYEPDLRSAMLRAFHLQEEEG